MPTYESAKFLSLPEQVNKNKKDIKVLQDNQADISNLIPKTEKAQPLGVATLDITGRVPAAQLPANPGNFLPLAGGTMAGDINLNNREITNGNTIAANQIITDAIQSPGGELEVFAPIFMDGNKIKGVAKGTATGEAATTDNINDHNTSPFAHADIRNLISAIQGAYVYRGVINENTVNVTQIALTNRLNAIMSRAPILGDVLTDLDRTDWYFDGASWDNMGQTFVVLASAVNDGLMSKEQYTKLFDLYTKAQLDATFEVLANKATDFAVLNDTKYPTTKAVDDSYATKTALALKANIAQEAWITPTLLNSWVVETSPAGIVGYMKDTLGFVHIKGRIENGTIGQNAFQLPIGYRPNQQLMFVGVDGLNQVSRIDIMTTGSVNIATGNNIRISLDGITFKAEA